MVIDIWAKDVETGDVVFVMEKNICKKIKNMSSLHLPRLLNGDTWRHTSLRRFGGRKRFFCRRPPRGGDERRRIPRSSGRPLSWVKGASDVSQSGIDALRQGLP